MSISDERMERALRYLAETDELVAEAKTQVVRLEFLAKRVRARVFLTAPGDTVREREAYTETTEDVKDVDETQVQAILAYEKLRAKRTTEELVIEAWRSLNASRRVGHV